MTWVSLSAWYRQYGFAVFERCRRLLGSHAEAEDAMHEVFLRVQRQLPMLEPDAPLRWLYTVADNHCLDLLKRSRRQVRGAQADEAMRALEDRADERNGERDLWIGQVLVACPPKVRDTATLYYLDELTQDEVADTLGCSRKTVKERLASFRELAEDLLREAVRTDFPTGEDR